MPLHPTTRRSFLKASTLAASTLALRGSNLLAQAAQADARIDILPAEPIGTISPEIYSHFIEHLGGVIYDGVWVGEGSNFHVFQMYLPHSGAQAVRAEFTAPSIRNPLANAPIPAGGNSYRGSLEATRTLAGLSGSASVATSGNGKQITLTVVNPHLDQALTTEVVVHGASITSATGTVLNEPDVHAHNDFAHPDAVHPRQATVGQPAAGRLMHSFPAASVTTLSLVLA